MKLTLVARKALAAYLILSTLAKVMKEYATHDPYRR
jgi:hypothetical protein